MYVHVIVWILSLCIVAFLNGAGILHLNDIIMLASLVVIGGLAGSAIAAASDTVMRRRQHQLVGGDDNFSSIWNGTVLAITSICMALMVDAGLQNMGWNLPYAMVILCPLSALAIWLCGTFNSSRLYLRMLAHTSPGRAAVALLFFGLVVGIATEVAFLVAAHWH